MYVVRIELALEGALGGEQREGGTPASGYKNGPRKFKIKDTGQRFGEEFHFLAGCSWMGWSFWIAARGGLGESGLTRGMGTVDCRWQRGCPVCKRLIKTYAVRSDIFELHKTGLKSQGVVLVDVSRVLCRKRLGDTSRGVICGSRHLAQQPQLIRPALDPLHGVYPEMVQAA